MQRRVIDGRTYYAFCAALLLFNSFLDYLVSMVLRIVGISNDYLRAIVYFIYVFAAFSALIVNLKNISLKSFILPVLLAVAFLMSISRNNWIIAGYKDTYLYLFLMCIPTYLVFRNYTTIKTDYDNLYKMVLTLSYVSGLFFAVIFSVHYFVLPILNSSNYQSTSYAMLLPLIFLLAKDKKTTFDKFLACWLLVLSLLAGGRASLFCLLVYFVFVLAAKGLKKPSYFLLIACLGLAGYFLLNPFLALVADVCNSLGIKGGIASYSARGDVYTDNRTTLYLFCLELSQKNGFHGFGMLGERMLILTIGQLKGVPEQVYAHNLFLELLLQYGFVITAIFVIWLLWKLYSFFANNRTNSKNKAVFCALFFSTGFLVLMFSTTYLTRPDFFALLGFVGLFPNRISNKKAYEGNRLPIERTDVKYSYGK